MKARPTDPFEKSEMPGLAEATERGSEPRLLLVGNPNVGKSVFFRLLTGRYVVVSNYPGTTVELSRGAARIAGRQVEVIDTPGANSLSPNSEDELVARDVVLAPGEKSVLQVADAKNLRRSLFLTAQLAELEIPMVLALNMWDEAEDRGIGIRLERLGAALGVPVVPTVATERRGFSRLLAALPAAAPSKFLPRYGTAVEQAVDEISALLPATLAGRRGLALMLLARSPDLEDRLVREAPALRDALGPIRRHAAAQLREPIGRSIQRRRAAHADALVADVATPAQKPRTAAGLLRTLFFLLVVPALFYAVGWRFSSFLFYTLSGDAPRFAALAPLGSALATHALAAFAALACSVSAWRKDYRAGRSPAISFARLAVHPVAGALLLLFSLWITYRVVGVFGAGDCVTFIEGRVFGTFDAASGQYGGLINGPLSRALGSLTGTGNLVYQFLFDPQAGLVSTGLTYAFAIVLPVVTLFFLLFALMEDSGYLPRLALLADRLFKRVGLSGKAVLPMVLGLGCGTMATLTTRILETRRQRLIAILLLSLAVPCSAQLGIIGGVLSAISATGVLIYIAVLAGSMFGVGWAAAKILPGEPADLLIEVPPFRWPRPWNVILKTYHRAKWFLREAVPLFLLGTVFLFVAERVGLIRILESAARPLVTGLLGLPVETTLGFILGFLRRDYGTVIIFQQFKHGHVNADQALIALIVITLFVPCLAHFFMCVKELGWRKALLMDLVVLVLAVLIGTAVRGLLALTGIHVALS